MDSDGKFKLMHFTLTLFEDKRQGIRFTKQDSITRISNLPCNFHFSSNVLLIF